MLEQQESLLPHSKPGERLPVLAVGVDKYGEESLDELKRLLDTLDVNTVGQVIMMQRSINPATYIGSGKLEEVRLLAEKESAKAVFFDVDLTPNQLKNLEKQLGIAVLDRSGVIIEIFSQHARTREAKVQVELARLQYLMPRLAHFWTHFERQRGGIGMKGMGETQIESALLLLTET